MTGDARTVRLSSGFEFLVAAACGAIVANLHFAQPVVGEIAATLGLAPQKAGLIITLTQLGYCAGLLLLVPLGDLVENRRLALTVLAVGAAAAATMASTDSPLLFLPAAFGLGIGSVSVQILLPYAAALAEPARQGRIVGRVMAGILTGIMLSRPISGLIAGPLGWRSVFVVAALSCLTAAAAIHRGMPKRTPATATTYPDILRSLLFAARHNRLLQRRAAYQFLMFYSYTVFWTALPLLLLSATYGLSHVQIGLVALAGAAGAIMSPIAGRVADKGLIAPGTTIALAAGVSSWLIASMGTEGGIFGIAALIVGAIVLDGAVPVSLVMSQRELFAAHPHERARLNGLFIAAFFVGGSIGATVGVWAFETWGWNGVVAAGSLGPASALAIHLSSRPSRPRGS